MTHRGLFKPERIWLYKDMEFKRMPVQKEGVSSVTKHIVKCKNNAEAKAMYRQARMRLLDVNNWQRVAGAGSATFTVMDDSGKETNSPPVVGNYFRIGIPFTPGSSAGKGFEWVIVEKINEQEYPFPGISIQVRPATPPFADKNEIAHFFSRTATSTFSVTKHDVEVTAQVDGRNEKPNTGVHSWLNKIRNMIIGILAMIGLNKPQWKSLVKGLLKEND